MAKAKICAVEDCCNHVHGRGYCNKHHRRLIRYGDVAVRHRVNNGEYDDWIQRHKDWEGDECLIWPYWRDKHGYGPSRKMCEAIHGAPPEPDMQAAHSCGNGHEGCTHPKHLRWATRSENQLEMVDHGNGRVGEINYMTPFTEQDVRDIRSLDGKVSRINLAARYGVTRETIRRVQKRITWGWLE